MTYQSFKCPTCGRNYVDRYKLEECLKCQEKREKGLIQ